MPTRACARTALETRACGRRPARLCRRYGTASRRGVVRTSRTEKYEHSQSTSWTTSPRSWWSRAVVTALGTSKSSHASRPRASGQRPGLVESRLATCHLSGIQTRRRSVWKGSPPVGTTANDSSRASVGSSPAMWPRSSSSPKWGLVGFPSADPVRRTRSSSLRHLRPKKATSGPTARAASRGTQV